MMPIRSIVHATSRRLKNRERGAVLIFAAALLTVLMAMAGFAIDFGWLYWQGINIQHGADAGALGGVVYEPEDGGVGGLAFAAARDVAKKNGYDDLAAGTIVTPADALSDPTAVANDNQLRVTVTHEVPTFFMKVFGIDSVSITKTAVAEYVLPLAMGSNDPYFGQDPVLGRNPNFWANIHGYFTGRTMGDRFASQCVDGGSTSSCTPNPEARPTTPAGMNNGIADFTGGYLYGIEVPPGGSDLRVEIFDGPFTRGGNDYVLVGDNPQGGSQGPTTMFLLYAPDPTPLNTSDGNKLLCKVVMPPRDPYMPTANSSTTWPEVDTYLQANPYVYNGKTYDELSDLWDSMCGVSFNEGEGIYPLRVVIADPGASDDRGLNRFSMRAFTTGTAPRMYGLGDMAIYANFAGNQATFNLAEVPEVHRGKDLVIELWDPDSGNNGVRVELPDGSLPDCSWTATDGRSGALAPCDFNFSPGFNNHHMQIRIEIDQSYTCGANCWWTLTVDYPGGANDTTTWSARVEGNPVKLVE
ncbi:MAG: TadE/TadG family type IV pilus assembly protein [Acidimicrobiia bacterium]